MTTGHAEILELVAGSIDFQISAKDARRVELHLAECEQCGRRIAAIRGDQRGLETLPALELDPRHATAIWNGVRASRSGPQPAFRVLAVAALLALLALLALAAFAGGGFLRHDGPLQPGVVPAGIDRVSLARTPSPSNEPAVDGATFGSGSLVDVAVTGLRVRTAPTVDNSKSAKLEPLLGLGVHLKILAGPVTADGYEWYFVQALDLPHQGWVAAADHDGEPWIRDPTVAAPADFSPEERSLVAALRSDASLGCAARRSGLPARSIAGVDCAIQSSLVGRVGAYRFATPADAARAYLERMAGYDVAPGTGDCGQGEPGDAPWLGSDGVGANGENVIDSGSGPRSVGRSGCFLNENDVANVRVTCGAMYVGVLGVDARIGPLYRWAGGSSETSDRPTAAPSICTAS